MAQGDTNLTNVVASGTIAATGAISSSSTVTAAGIVSSAACTPTLGTGTQTFNSMGVLSLQVTQVSTAANTTETDGHTYTLPANSLSASNKGVRVRIWGTTGATVNNKTVKLYLGSTVIYTTGAVAANAKDFYIEANIVRTGAATQTALISGHFNGTPITASSRATGTESFTGALVIKSTMTNGTAAASDITVNGFEVTALP